MLVLRHRLAIAGVVTAAAVAVPAAALASGLGSAPGKPAPPQASAPGAGKSPAAPSQLTALAASAGISVSQLQAGLAAAKRDGGDTAAGVTAFAASTGVSNATAQRVLNAVFNSSPSGKPAPQKPPAPGVSKSAAAQSQVKHAQPDLPPAPVRAFAARLGVGTSAAGRAFKQITGLSGNGRVDPGSPAFAAIARELGVSPAQLAAAWDAAR
jgi:hypothetical protein